MGATEAIESETNAIATARQQMRMNNPRPGSSLRFQGKNRNGQAPEGAFAVPVEVICSLIGNPDRSTISFCQLLLLHGR
jgi:hypothetical protein